MARRQTLQRRTTTSDPIPAPLTYAWYYSSNHVRDRQASPTAAAVPARGTNQADSRRARFSARSFALVAAIFVVFGLLFYSSKIDDYITRTTTSPKSTPAHSTANTPNACASNTLGQLVLVSINQRHLWACSGTTTLYDSPVVTGIASLAADATPTGTYRIYAKQTNLHLTGSDSTGSWDDYVHYWMPFLDNQYGQYGFHDATWRPNSTFGNISPDSHNGSHGCVECPLATAQWLYGWVRVGTTVKIAS